MKQVIVLLPVLLVIASSCLDGEFTCPSGECPSAGLVCDFKTDCENGTEEEFCGSCNFDHHSCGWNDTSDKSYRWRRQMANITSVPGVDHTTGSPWGYVMHIDGKQEGGTIAVAQLEYSVDKLAAPGCQLSFWYSIYENTSSSSSSTIKVTMIRGTTETELKPRISESKTNGWQNATVFIGNQPVGYKLRLSFSPPYLAKKDVMLDDITFQYCAEGDVPAGSDQLSCDFEKDTCSWYHDYTASFLWKRSDGGFNEGPAGKGYYMLISSRNSPDISSAARLVSLPQPAGQVICVNFVYHIFGKSIGTLKFIAKRSGEAEAVVWMRSGTQGNKWRFADLTFNSDKPIQFIIEAVVGGNDGSIAIDDITVYSSETGSCPAETECTFQGSLCGLRPHPSSDFSWSRITGTSQPANSSGPATDHTLGTDQGYYLSAQLWSRPVGSRVTVVTAVMEQTASDGECLMFWYYMEGSGAGELNVYLQTKDNKESSAPLWTRSGDQGKRWRHGRVTLLSPEAAYQVVFEAVVGDGPRRDVAIDDLFVLNGACPPQGFCDFEMDFCGWVNNPPAEFGVDWEWLSKGGGPLVPDRDHTTNSASGHYVFFKPTTKEEIAQLQSETMEVVDRGCLEIWHQAHGWLSEDGPSEITLTVFVNETAGLRPVWNTSGYTNDSWIQDRVDYSASGLHQIILQASCPKSNSGSFALDDVHIIRDRSCDDIIPTTTSSPPTTTTAAPASTMDCTFEQGLCNWVQEAGDDVNWILRRGLQLDQPWDGPPYDHTVGNNQGSFLLLNGTGSKDGETAVVSVPVVTSSSPLCVGFWYHMLGPSVSTLDLLVVTKTTEELVWTRRGTQKPEWIQAQVTISMTNITQMMLTGRRNTNSKGFIAIDDITVREGACSNQNECGFDSSLCDFENDVSHMGRWISERGTKYEVDHTYGTEEGFYATVMRSDSAQTEVAQLLTPEFPSRTEKCVRFWYWLPAGSSNILAVHVKQGEELADALWQRSGAPSLGWEVAEVTVSSPVKFRVAFKAEHEPGTNFTVKLDDISLRDGVCSPPASCDFESGQCNWINIPTEDGHDWVLAQGGFWGPPADHTTQTAEGWFLLSSSLHQNRSSLAHVLSEWIHLRDNTFCLTLWCYMDGSDLGTLKVYMRSGPAEQDLIFNSNSSGGSWTRFSQSVERNKPFQLLIEAETHNRGFIAIDDISVTSGLCQVNDTSSGFLGCSFESGTCGWEDISAGELQWMRGRNASGNTGPSVDNTVGTELGWYMTVKSDQGDQVSPAAMQSPTMKQASATCTLQFFYNMFGEDKEELYVVLKEGPRTTTLWWLSGSRGDLWHHSEVTVGRIPHDFNIQFEAFRSFTKPGHIAIDDIDFINCTLPEPQPLCPENMFKCNNSVCVERSRVCDFSDDCGDQSDETNCEAQGVVERCSFGQGLCSWGKSDVDTLGAEWTIHKGQDAWPKHGPPRDHTQNSGAGHYLIPGTEKGQTAEILSKTLLPSSDCTVRFFFFSLDDDAAATLTAQSRTLRSGSDDTVLWLRGKSQSYSWQRAEVTFSSSRNSKIVFRYKQSDAPRGFVALDDISFSRECIFDPDNNKLPDTSPTFAPPTSTITASTTPTHSCQDNEFFCSRSAGKVCILATLRCDYRLDCPQGEDEDGCGPCNFENDQCQWTDVSVGPSRWKRDKASILHQSARENTTGLLGYFMRVVNSDGSTQSEARLQSPSLPPSSPYCQVLFHFHIGAESAGSLRVLMQQADGGEAILWSRSHNTVSDWTPEHLPVGRHQKPYKVWFSSINKVTQTNSSAGDLIAVDDFSFVNCENSYQPPALSACDCSFEDGQCVWMQGAEDDLDWYLRAGPTSAPNTGPSGDHTTGKGKYLYVTSHSPGIQGYLATLKSPLLPPAGEKGYCFTFWHHMFGATVGSLRILLQTANPLKKTEVWQKSGNQGDEWLLGQIHVTLQEVHQVILEASVGGEEGDIAIDDISFISGPCPASDVCDFEDGSCNWQQDTTDDFDWVRQSGSSVNPNSGPDSDHTTNMPTGHYYYLSSSAADRTGQTAYMSSPLYQAGTGACVQLWYHMYGRGMGTFNVYQETDEGKQTLIFSQMGDQGRLWRFAQASLLPHVRPYRIVVEGVKSGPAVEGDMAFDDVRLSNAQCPPSGHCDFESGMCSWSNLGGGVDQGDWLRGKGASQGQITGPSVDHTTNSGDGYYLYVDSSVGEWGDTFLLYSDVFQPSTRGHCLTFWYHMMGNHVGTLRVFINDRKMQAGGTERGTMKWMETGNKGDKWQEARVQIKHEEAFWFVFEHQRGMFASRDVALDDITIMPGDCDTESIIDPPDNHHDTLSVGLAVGLTLLAGVIIAIVLFMLIRRRKMESILDHDAINQNSTFDLYDCRIGGTQHGTESDFSFFNKLYNPSSHEPDGTMASSDA